MAVSLMARANAIAPRRPVESHIQENQIIESKHIRPDVMKKKTMCFFRTCKHHHVLEISFDFVPSTEVEQEGEWVNVEGSSNEYRELAHRKQSRNL